jgi:hypothetical protein
METSPFSASRRRFLLGGMASVLAGSLVGNLSSEHATGQDAWVEKILRKNLPGIKLDEASLPHFFRDIHAKGLLDAYRHRLAVFLDQTIPTPTNWVTMLRHAIEGRERLVLSEFLLGSNFFQAQDPMSETITYFGPSPVCGNPFVVYRNGAA